MRLLSARDGWSASDEIADDELAVAMTRAELAFLANSIQESLEAVEDWEFGTRLGMPPEAARSLRDRVSDVLARADSGE